MSLTNSKIRNKLSAKDNKMFIFGYWFVKQISPELQEQYMSHFHCGGDLEKQTQIFDIFWDDYKETEKTLKKTKQTNQNEKKKRGRPKKEKTLISSNNELLNMLIAEARKEIKGPICKEISPVT